MMKQPLFKHEEEIEEVKISRPGSDGYALFRMALDPERNETVSAVLGIHEHPAGIEPVPPHYHREVEETVYIVSGEGELRMGYDVKALQTYKFRPGSCWYIPPECFHEIKNTGSEPIKMVVSYFRNDGKPISHRQVSKELTIVAQPT